MFIFELLGLVLFVLVLAYLAFFSPKFDKFVRSFFKRPTPAPESADAIAESATNIRTEADKVRAALAAREKAIADEKAKLGNIKV